MTTRSLWRRLRYTGKVIYRKAQASGKQLPARAMFQRSRSEIGSGGGAVARDVSVMRPPYNSQWVLCCRFVRVSLGVEHTDGQKLVSSSQRQMRRAPGINAIAGCRVEKAPIINNMAGWRRGFRRVQVWMTGGWGVYVGAVSIEATTVPLALHPSVVHCPLTYAYDTGIARAYAYFVSNNNNNK